MGDTVIELFEEYLDDAIEEIKFSVASGRCATFEDYKYMTGTIHGLEQAKLIIHDEVAKTVQIQNFEDDED